jgi:hypothetical protein
MIKNNYKFILICSTGRSGSTTLQRIINTIPNTNICGENHNAILHLLNSYKSIKLLPQNNNYEYYKEKNKKPCWYNHFDKEKIIDDFKNIIIQFLNYEGNAINIGFKEIRYNEINIQILNEFVDLFPNTKILLHIRRDIESQSKSGWWAHNNDAYAFLEKKNNILLDYHKNNTNNTYMSYFEDLFDLEKIKNIYTFLNLEEYFDENKINEILNNNLK